MKRADIVTGLTHLGLQAGDTVLVHSSLASLGHVEGGAETVLDAFLAVLGAAGTLVVPIVAGAIPTALRERADVVESVHPIAKVAAIGAALSRCCNHD